MKSNEITSTPSMLQNRIICSIKGENELLSIIERKVSPELLLKPSSIGEYAFHLACKLNNISIMKRV